MPGALAIVQRLGRRHRTSRRSTRLAPVSGSRAVPLSEGGAGARLRFAGLVGDTSLPIAFIIAMPGLERGIEGLELASNVTVIEESSSRFFRTAELESCWTDIETAYALDESGDRFVIDGVLYCISPLPEVNGDASVSIPEMRFSGLLDWTAT